MAWRAVIYILETPLPQRVSSITVSNSFHLWASVYSFSNPCPRPRPPPPRLLCLYQVRGICWIKCYYVPGMTAGCTFDSHSHSGRETLLLFPLFR